MHHDAHDACMHICCQLDSGKSKSVASQTLFGLRLGLQGLQIAWHANSDDDGVTDHDIHTTGGMHACLTCTIADPIPADDVN